MNDNALMNMLTNDYDFMCMFVKMAMILSEQSDDGCFELTATAPDGKKKIIRVQVDDEDDDGSEEV